MSISEWDHREVCPDGACIGVIGDDGLCKVCGHAAPNWGNERARGLVDDQSDAPEDGDGDGDDELGASPEDGEDEDEDGDDEGDADDAADGDEPDDWARRELCSNGACVGVIGPDGRCTACGSAPA